MKNQSSINYPINLNHKDLHIFDNVKNYTIEKPIIKKLKNVFVTNNGLVLKNGILNSKSGLNLKTNYDHSFYFEYWLTALEQNLVCKFGKSIPSIHLKKKTYLLIHSKWLNYSFWVTEYLQRLVRVEKEIGFDNLILLYPEEWDSISYIQESLNAFKIEKYKIPSGHHLFIENLIFPETRTHTSAFFPEFIKLTKERLLIEGIKRIRNINTPKYIYISRGYDIRRKIINENELQTFLKEKGFYIIYFENLSFWEQIVYMNNAEIVIANHGAGLANILFMNSNKIVLEFLEKDFAHYANPLPHWKLAAAVNVKYAYQFCRSNDTKDIKLVKLNKATKKDRMNLVNRDIIVDIFTLNENINLFLNTFN
jgi:hypothetical protein